ncbi:PRKC apoptosis WT1 regulator protein isoform X2 [Notamacropus eugenii]
MATGGYRTGPGPTTDFLEEWKAKREKMRAKQSPQGLAAAAATAGGAGSDELNSHPPAPSAPAPAAPAAPDPRRAEDEEPPGPSSRGGPEAGGQPPPGEREERDGGRDKGKSSGPSARKGKGQIEKRKLREKRRSTGVVNIPAAECLDEYEDDEAGQKERKREDAITQQNTMQNESATSDPGASSLLQETSRTVSSRYKSTNVNPEDDVSSRYSRTDRVASRHSRDPPSSHLVILQNKIEDLEKEVIKERQENLRLQKLIQDKEDIIGKLKEEIDLLNRDLDDTEDENEQLKQENKTLLKVVGQLTR